MRYDFDRQVERRGTDSTKWGYYAHDVLPLWVADMDFISAEPILRALRERVEHGVFGYPIPPPELYELVQARLRALYNWEVAHDEILFVPGVVPGFNVACHAVGEPGDGVLVQPPVYYPFLTAPGNAGRVRQYAQVGLRGQRYEVDYDAFESAITDRTSMFLFCNPHNPVGRVYRKDELARMAEICLRHDLVICSDEIHCDLVFSGHRHLPIASLAPEIAARTITLMAPSKTFNIAGLHCSFAVIQDRELRQAFQAARGGMVGGTNVLAYAAAIAAYRDGGEWLDQVLAYVQANRDYLQGYVSEHLPGIEMIPLEGTYLAWLDCRGSGIEGKPGEFFRTVAHVALNEGEAFGPGGEGFVRLNLGCPRATLVEALERMRAALVEGREHAG